MGDPRDNGALRSREQLAFFGRVVAGQCHDVTNVLTIINELAGLQNDLLAAGDCDGPPVERLAAIASKVCEHVKRGERILKTVNRFAHSVDAPRSVLDLREAVERAACLAERPVRLRRATLQLELSEAPMVIEGDPFAIQQAVMLVIEAGLDAGARQLTLCYDADLSAARVSVRGSFEDGCARPRAAPDGLQAAARSAGADLRAGDDAHGSEIVALLIPRAGDPDADQKGAKT